jgi:hypothetical protein
MRAGDKKDIHFIFYMVIIVIMAFVYFMMPERPVFLENQLKWWQDLIEVIKK